MPFTEFLLDCLTEASILAKQSFGKVTGAAKPGDNNQVLTETDLAIGRLLISRIEQAFPTDNIIDEEAGVIDRGSHFTWVVDPIDGTSNFAAGVPTYGIMVGLLEEAKPILGAIAMPSFNSLCWAAQGGGAFLNGEAIRVAHASRLIDSLVAYGIDGHPEDPDLSQKEANFLRELVLRIRNLRCSNSCFDTVCFARGAYGGYLNHSSKIWDNVAQHVILEEAGSLYTDFYGEPMDYTSPLLRTRQNFTWCAAPAGIHKELQEIVTLAGFNRETERQP